jgi:hypothetical protein
MTPGISLKITIQKTLLRNKKTVDQIADEVGRSSNILYRYGLEGESGAEMPVSLLVPIMKSTGNYSILKHIAQLCGFILVKIPRVKAGTKDELEMIDDYQSSFVNSVKNLKDFFNSPSPENYTTLNNSLIEVMEQCSKNQKYAEKKLTGQFEMEL